MSTKHLRLALGIAAVLGLLAAALGAAALGDSGSVAARTKPATAGEAAKLPKLAQKKLAIAKRAQATTAAPFGNEEGGIEGYAAEEWAANAYPATDIPLARILGARNAFKALESRSLSSRAPTGLWDSLGPSNAFAPFNQFRDRSVYTSAPTTHAGRTTDVALDPNCSAARCRMWIAVATGGVWRTENALAAEPTWEYLSATFDINAIGSIELDPNDPSGDTLWVGTGEFNSCGSGCVAGVGLYKTTDGGNSWTGPLGSDVFNARGVSTIAVKPGDPQTIYAGSGRAILGMSETCCGGVQSIIPGAPRWGLYKSEDGGTTWRFIHNGTADENECVGDLQEALGNRACSPRGVRRVMIDPNDPNTLYASSLGRGIWRSRDNGENWQIVMPRLGTNVGAAAGTERAEFDLVDIGAGTRMFVGVGNISHPVEPDVPPNPIGTYARFRRSDNVLTASPASFVDLTSATPDTPGYSSFGYCDPQCVYDNGVTAIDANRVYLIGDNEYNENNWVTGRSNGRGILYTENAGAPPGEQFFWDFTEDNRDDTYPFQAHPDHHRLVYNPRNPLQFWDVGDGGITRSNGQTVNDSEDCATPKRYTGSRLAFCQLVLSKIPVHMDTINRGLDTLQPYNLAWNPLNPTNLLIGTQDNGTWETLGDRVTWHQIEVADGGPPLFDYFNPNLTQSSYQTMGTATGYTHMDPVDRNWTADTFFYPPGPNCDPTRCYGNEARAFIGPSRADPRVSQRIFAALEHVFRSDSFGSHLSVEKHRQHCNNWYGDGDVDEDGTYEPNNDDDICDDWRPLGNPGAAGRLTNVSWGSDRTGGHVGQLERAPSDAATLWASTSTGRVFVSKNVNAADPAAVSFTRIDTLATNDPNRYVTAIYVDPRNPNHAYLTYAGFSANDAIAGGAGGTTPSTAPGHIFEVFYNRAAGTATWTSLDGEGPGAFGDIPATDIVRDEGTGTLYVATDFGVVMRRPTSTDWIVVPGLPMTPVSDLEIAQNRRVLYAAVFGRSVWQLTLA